MFICAILIVILISSQLNLDIVFAKEEYYARVMYEQVNFYRQPLLDESMANVWFELPKTYFVKLLDRAGDDFYLAEYNGIQGYVKKDSVRAINGTPSNPYLKDIFFRIYAEPSRDMRSFPAIDNTLSEQVTYIPLYSKNIEYISRTIGQELILNRTNVWYYCKYTTDKEYFGYVYSDFCDEITQINNNNENVTYIDNPTFIVENSNDNISSNSKLLGIVLAIMCVPTLAFVFLIIRGKHIMNYQKSKKEIIDY